MKFLHTTQRGPKTICILYTFRLSYARVYKTVYNIYFA